MFKSGTKNQKKRQKRFVLALAMVMGLCFAAAGTAIAAEPKAGDVINSGNIAQYKDYFPSFMARYIQDGWGFETPVVITVKAREEVPMTQAFQEATKKNAATTKLTAEGLLEGFSEIGMPFIDPKEPDLGTKVMWNQFYKELPDDWTIPKRYLSFSKRKGGTVAVADSTYDQLKFMGRTGIDPKPELKNPKGLMYANILNSSTPPNKDMATLSWRYRDAKKYDDMWTYVPTLRRTLRMVSSERANPIRGTPYTWDDIFGFDGKINLFTFKYLGDQKVLSLQNQKLTAEEVGSSYVFHPVLFQGEAYEVVDCYMIEIRPKDPRYPSAHKTTWVSKQNFKVCYTEIFDKQDEFWKGYYNCAQRKMLKTGEGKEEAYPITSASGMSDFKTQYYTATITGNLIMNGGITPDKFDPGVLGTF